MVFRAAYVNAWLARRLMNLRAIGYLLGSRPAPRRFDRYSTVRHSVFDGYPSRL